MKNIADSTSIAEYIATDFMVGGDYNGTWGEHAGSWIINAEIAYAFSAPNAFGGNHSAFHSRVTLDQLSAHGHGRACALRRPSRRYRDQLGGIARFIGTEASVDRIRLAVERSSAQNMRTLESA